VEQLHLGYATGSSLVEVSYSIVMAQHILHDRYLQLSPLLRLRLHILSLIVIILILGAFVFLSKPCTTINTPRCKHSNGTALIQYSICSTDRKPHRREVAVTAPI